MYLTVPWTRSYARQEKDTRGCAQSWRPCGDVWRRRRRGQQTPPLPARCAHRCALMWNPSFEFGKMGTGNQRKITPHKKRLRGYIGFDGLRCCSARPNSRLMLLHDGGRGRGFLLSPSKSAIFCVLHTSWLRYVYISPPPLRKPSMSTYLCELRPSHLLLRTPQQIRLNAIGFWRPNVCMTRFGSHTNSAESRNTCVLKYFTYFTYTCLATSLSKLYPRLLCLLAFCRWPISRGSWPQLTGGAWLSRPGWACYRGSS